MRCDFNRRVTSSSVRPCAASRSSIALSPACTSRGSALLTFSLLIHHVLIADNGRYVSIRGLLDDHEILLFFQRDPTQRLPLWHATSRHPASGVIYRFQ